MNITTDNEIMIFRKDFDGRPIYSLGLSKKNMQGQYENGYIQCNFKKGVNLENKTKIFIKKAWLSFYLKDKKTIPTIFISEFDIKQETAKKPDIDPYGSFAEQIEIDMTNDYLD